MARGALRFLSDRLDLFSIIAPSCAGVQFAFFLLAFLSHWLSCHFCVLILLITLVLSVQNAPHNLLGKHSFLETELAALFVNVTAVSRYVSAIAASREGNYVGMTASADYSR